MFDHPGPRVFGLAPGVDFPKGLLLGLEQRLISSPPEDWAKVEIFVNTRRMERRLRDLFDAGPARLLPRIRLITDLAGLVPDLPPAAPALRRRLELAQLVASLIARAPDLAPRASAFDLANSLAALMDEMHGEGVDPVALHDLDVAHLSDHWARTRAFIGLVERYFGQDSLDMPDAEARQRMAVQRISALWGAAPPQHPVIVAGSTGSRGATALFMEAVARLPQGAVILPGFDFDMPVETWAALKGDALAAEDHPQYRFYPFLGALNLTADKVRPWARDLPAPNPARNRLLSLALRPAPVTDQWLKDGPDLGDLTPATQDITLIEAPSPRAEAVAIALRLRKAAEDGVPAALITPDRNLTRRVAAMLDRWGVEPDDSAGTPLPTSAPGRFLRQIASLFGRKLTGEALLALLKHPLCASGSDRGAHLLWARELELKLRAKGPAFPTGADLIHWTEARSKDDGRAAWARWLAALLDGLAEIGTRPLSSHVLQHLALAEAFAQGPEGTGSGGLWDQPAGQQAQAATSELAQEAEHGGDLSPSDYSSLFYAILNRKEVRDPILPHPGIMIWGTLEARVQGADLIILAGLNEGSWPQLPPPDPWLNRDMRKRLGLLLPERRIGLAAHDFQQAAAAGEIVLSRAVRDAEAETVASRWLNRLTNLLAGLPDQNGPKALTEMRARGQKWLALAAVIDRPTQTIPPAPRPAPCPPVAARPTQLSVTRIQTLIRDPYSIYASYILGLRPLFPLRAEADAMTRGTILHSVMERFLREGVPADEDAATEKLLHIADEVFADEAPWPAARRLWRARLARVATPFLRDEARRQAEGHWIALEEKGSVTLENGFTLTAEADRLDHLESGGLAIFDYKTGTPPSKKQMEIFDKQLFLEALIAERAGFGSVPPQIVEKVAYIGLGNNAKEAAYPIEMGQLNDVWKDLHTLIDHYRDPARGYIPRRMAKTRDEATDFDQLSRFGEWDESQPAQIIKVGS